MLYVVQYEIDELVDIYTNKHGTSSSIQLKDNIFVSLSNIFIFSMVQAGLNQ